jgi:hypothetical protein
VMMNLFGAPGGRALWKERSYLFGEQFRRYIENDLMIKPPHPDAKPLGAFTIARRTEKLTGVIGNGFCDIERRGFSVHVVRAHLAFRDHASNCGFKAGGHFSFFEPVEHQFRC